jgi:DNA-directed RNA polymerase specialized sigma24 family protein
MVRDSVATGVAVNMGSMMAPAATEHSGAFKPTRWSLVMRAAGERSVSAAAALDELCRTYWYPLYCFARRRGLGVADAEDATQGFFVRVLEMEMFTAADPAKGRLRSYLLTAFQRYLIDFDKHRFALKRGGPAGAISLDAAEERYRLEPVDDHTPEKLFQQKWALALLASALADLEQEWADAGKAEAFSVFRQFLSFAQDESPQSYQSVAGRLDMTPGAARLGVHRLRKRYREVLYSHIADTLSEPTPSAIQKELRALFSAVS